MEIKVLGPGCAKCQQAEKLVKETVAEMKADVNIEKVSDMMQIAGYGVFSTPAIVVDGVVKCAGKVPKKEEIRQWIGK